MTTVLAFDVYGTLIDTSGVVARLTAFIGDDAGSFSDMWREKQLEYSFRRGLMRRYETFAVCTKDALEYCCRRFGDALTAAQKQELLDVYRRLPAFPEVAATLDALSGKGWPIHAFSNGTADAVGTLLENAGIRDRFDGVVSVDDVRSFKPDPQVYARFLAAARCNAGDAWLVSGNPFDVIGAISAGMKGIWVRRSDSAVFDPWGIEPTRTIRDLSGIEAAIDR